ncbi:MAG: 3-deoxy-7-phosphoheptulonate synthase [Spirochaetales bacterium]|nr:3-deoxy-7-phosphoheptulonate synthase [Spirochaetales bacterium]
MIIVLHNAIKAADKRSIYTFLEGKGMKIKEIVGEEETILGVVGTVSIDHREVELLPGVERVLPISKPYKLTSRELKKDDTIVSVGGIKIGGPRITVIAGPCSIESREQIMESARLVREAGGVMLRGGAYKPRTSPYAFQGMGEEGLKLLKEAGESVGLPVATEIVSGDHCDLLKEYADVIQIGTRNMQNFELLKKVGAMGKPVILKRGFAATIEEWLMAAEYILAHGTEDVILCERGIRTFETYTRNTLDLSAIPVVKKLSHLPVIVDPSHATGIRDKVLPMALAGIAAGADGLIIEMHPQPEKAMSDGAQSLYPEQLEKLMRDIKALAPVLGKEIEQLPFSLSAASEVKGGPGVLRMHPRVGYQGEHGAYSERAVNTYFIRQEPESVPLPDFQTVFESVLKGEVDYGVVPIENTLGGSIHENYDNLLNFTDIQIIGEKKIRIEHNLIGFPGTAIDDIEVVYSHPQGLAQCTRFLKAMPKARPESHYDTAGSVKYIKEQGNTKQAAIASAEAAAYYGMEILKAGIETNPRNYTRFFILARTDAFTVTSANKASFVFSTGNKPGALFICLKILAENGVNMTKLESRPIPGKPWEYMFYLDVDIPDAAGNYERAIGLLKEEALTFRVLGEYRV